MAWIIDVLFIVLLIVGIWLGASRGFVKSIAKFAGTFFAAIFAFTFAVSFSNILESWFGMTTGLTNWMSGFFTGDAYVTEFGRTLTGAELPEALSEVNGIARILISAVFKNAEEIAATATPGLLLGMTLANWSSLIISFAILFILIKLGIYLIAKLMDSLINKLAAFRIINQTLGGIFGLFKTLLLLFIVLMICSWLPIDALQEFISSSAIVGSIYNSDWFHAATAYLVSGEWFNDYITNFLQ